MLPRATEDTDYSQDVSRTRDHVLFLGSCNLGVFAVLPSFRALDVRRVYYYQFPSSCFLFSHQEKYTRWGLAKWVGPNLQCPLDSVPIWLLTPYKSYRNGPTCVRGSSRSSRPVFWRCGTYRVKSRPLTGKMTGVSDLSQNTPFWVVKRLS